jgi:hypothetical protein
MKNDTNICRGEATRTGRVRRKIAVIADDGAEIALVLLDDSQPATTGARFSHRGRLWEIRGSRQGSRVLVAEPAERPRH